MRSFAVAVCSILLVAARCAGGSTEPSGPSPCPCPGCSPRTVPFGGYLAVPNTCLLPPCEYALAASAPNGDHFRVIVTNDRDFQAWRDGGSLWGYERLTSEARSTCFAPPPVALNDKLVWTVFFCGNVVGDCHLAQKIDYSSGPGSLVVWSLGHPLVSVALLTAALAVVALCCGASICCCWLHSGRRPHPAEIEMGAM